MKHVACTAMFVCLFALTGPIPVRAQTPAGPKYLAFAFADDAHGWAAGAQGIDVTFDGGHTWAQQFRGGRVDELVLARRRSIYALAAGSVLHSGDDGASWQLISTPKPALKRLAFSSDRDGFGIGLRGRLFATSDGGHSWHRSSFSKAVNAVCFSDKRTGFVGGAVPAPALDAFDGIAATSDGGRTWSTAGRPPTGDIVGIAGHTLHCTQGSVYDLVDLGAHAGGGAYILARSTDAGQRWKPIVVGGQAPRLAHVPVGPGTEATSMSAYDPTAAYVAGFCGACGRTGLSSFGATTDGGKSWHNTKLGAIGFTSAPVFTSAVHGVIGAREIITGRPPQDEVLATNDAGRTWTNIFVAR